MTRFASSPAWSDAGAQPILARYEALVHQIAFKMRPRSALGHCLEREDLIAEGRVAVLEAVSTYQEYGVSERSWVARMVRRRMLDAIRRLDVRSRPELERAAAWRALNPNESGSVRVLTFVSDESELHSHDWNQEDQARAAEVAGMLKQAIERLPSRQREVAESVAFRGEDLSSIAKRLGVTVARVSQVFKAACEQIRSDVRSQID